MRVEQVDNQRSDLIVVRRCSRIAESAKSASAALAPATSEAVVEGIEGLLILGHLDRYDRHITARFHRRQSLLLPRLCSQLL